MDAGSNAKVLAIRYSKTLPAAREPQFRGTGKLTIVWRGRFASNWRYLRLAARVAIELMLREKFWVGKGKRVQG